MKRMMAIDARVYAAGKATQFFFDQLISRFRSAISRCYTPG